MTKDRSFGPPPRVGRLWDDEGRTLPSSTIPYTHEVLPGITVLTDGETSREPPRTHHVRRSTLLPGPRERRGSKSESGIVRVAGIRRSNLPCLEVSVPAFPLSSSAGGSTEPNPEGDPLVGFISTDRQTSRTLVKWYLPKLSLVPSAKVSGPSCQSRWNTQVLTSRVLSTRVLSTQILSTRVYESG